MVNAQGQKWTRQANVATLHRIAAEYAGGYREGLSRPDALTELAAVSADASLLSEAAARHAVADNWYAITAVDLLLEAGAEQWLIEHHLCDAQGDHEWAFSTLSPDQHRWAS